MASFGRHFLFTPSKFKHFSTSILNSDQSKHFLLRLPCQMLRSYSERFISSELNSLEDLENILNQPSSKISSHDKRQALLLEYDYRQYMGESVPHQITDKMWRKLLEDGTTAEIRRGMWDVFYAQEEENKFKVRGQKLRAQHRLERMRQDVKQEEKENFDGEIWDATGLNKAGVPENLLCRINSNYAKHRYKCRMNYAINFGQHLVFDFGLLPRMTSRSQFHFQKHMKSIYAYNQRLWEPFNLHICNYNPNVTAYQKLIDENLRPEFSSGNLTSKCFTDVFPPEKIVYLSPESPTVLKSFEHDSVYVIGATIDQFKDQSLSFAKIKELGLKSARLDIDTYCIKKSHAMLNLMQMFRVLTDARDTDGNWLYSLRHLCRPNQQIKWRRQFKFMEETDLDYKKKIDFRDPMELETWEQSSEPIFVNERSIFKPKANPKAQRQNRGSYSNRYNLAEVDIYTSDETSAEFRQRKNERQRRFNEAPIQTWNSIDSFVDFDVVPIDKIKPYFNNEE